MPHANTRDDERPTTEEIRTALDRIAVSEAFRACPQLVAFLRYVVEATLRGGQDRIKGYTIAVEAFGRGDDFNPQDDPIVRVEAMRLRRALQRYYANGGRDEAVRIILPLGSYVPEFCLSTSRAESGHTEEAPAARPAWHAFLTFLTAYLADDRAGAARYAALIPPDGLPLDLVARALVAAHRGEADAARSLLHRLDASLPEWRVGAGTEFRHFPDAITGHVARDLAQIEGVAAKP
jgi:hypothetical protein